MTTPDLPPPAQEAAFYCNKCGYFGPGGPSHKRGGNEPCNYLAAQIGPHWTRDQLLAAIAPYKAEIERLKREGEHYDCNVAILTKQRDEAEAAIAPYKARIKQLESGYDELRTINNRIQRRAEQAEAAIAAEREAIAQMVQAWAADPDITDDIAAAIRARGSNA